jgi:hypothetical protein
MQGFAMRNLIWASVILSLSLLALAACSSETEVAPTDTPPLPATADQPTAMSEALQSPLLQPSSPLPTPASGTGMATGRIASRPDEWSGQELWVYFAPFVGDVNDEGIYVLEPSAHPRTRVSSDGSFDLINIPPGNYVVVIGPSPEEAIPVTKDDRPEVFSVQAGELLEMGAVEL